MKIYKSKNISLKHPLNKTQYNLFCLFSNPLKTESNEEYQKIKAINNVDNNILYYIHKNKKKYKKLFSEEKEKIIVKNKANSKNKVKNKKKFNQLNQNNNNNKEELSKSFKKSFNEYSIKSIKSNNSNKKPISKRQSIIDEEKKARLSKLSKDYHKILKGKLDKELVINIQNQKNNNDKEDSNLNSNININKDYSAEESKNMTLINLNNKTDSNNINKINQIYRYVKADNKIFNNCFIRKKIIYDIKPLNKLKEKGRCKFPKNLIDEKYKTESTSITKDSFFNKNLFFQEKFVENGNLTSYNTNFNLYKEEPYSNINKDENINKRHSNRFFSERIKKDNNANLKNNFHLSDLYKDLPSLDKKKNKNIFIYYKNGVGVSRGEKIKFLKTCYPINLVKPMDTQNYFKIKMPKYIEKKKEIIINRFPVNHYNLDIINKNNIRQINALNKIQNSISNKIKNEFNLLYNSIIDNDIKQLNLNT